MIPKDKIEAIVSKHNSIEKELSSGNVDPKNFADKSKPCFKVLVKKLQIFRFLVDKIRLIFAGESNSFFGRN